MTNVHLCSTVHRGILPFLGDFLASVAGQTTADFDLWIALDGVAAETVVAALPMPGDGPTATAGRTAAAGALSDRLRFVAAGGSPADVRTALFAEVARVSAPDDVVVMADADDVLEAARVAAATAATRAADVSACPLRLIDGDGDDLGVRFAEPPEASPAALDELLPRGNVFGLSNSCYRLSALRAGLPVPSGCIAVDWYLATAAWLDGARLALERVPQMRYRQYAENLAPVVPPFTAEVLERTTAVVCRHHQLVEGHLSGKIGGSAARRAALRAAHRAADDFAAAIADPVVRDRYLAGLNRLPPPQAWWTMVAHPALEELWRT